MMRSLLCAICLDLLKPQLILDNQLFEMAQYDLVTTLIFKCHSGLVITVQQLAIVRQHKIVFMFRSYVFEVIFVSILRDILLLFCFLMFIVLTTCFNL